MKLYFHPMSGNSRRVLLTAAHLELPIERVVVDLVAGEHRGPAHVARNPNAKVPVLEDGDLVLWESRAIMQYLCDRTPGQTLWPTEVRARADVNRWMFWCAMHMASANAILVQERVVKALAGRGPADPAEEARGEALVRHSAGLLDAHLAGKTWVAQDRLTLADLSLAAGFALAGPARLPIDDLPHLQTWLARVADLPAWQRTTPPPPPARG